MKIKVEKLTAKSFEPFGEIIGEPEGVKPEITNPIVDVWPGVSNVKVCDEGHFYWLDIRRQESYICDTLEKHKKCGEFLMPVKGQSIAVFGLSKDKIAENEDLDTDTVKAFIFDGSSGVNMDKGVWHWIPFPLSETATFVAIIEKNAHNDDLLIKDFKKEQGLVMELEL